MGKIKGWKKENYDTWRNGDIKLFLDDTNEGGYSILLVGHGIGEELYFSENKAKALAWAAKWMRKNPTIKY